MFLSDLEGENGNIKQIMNQIPGVGKLALKLLGADT
jgi:hypothetical protein